MDCPSPDRPAVAAQPRSWPPGSKRQCGLARKGPDGSLLGSRKPGSLPPSSRERTRVHSSWSVPAADPSNADSGSTASTRRDQVAWSPAGSRYSSRVSSDSFHHSNHATTQAEIGVLRRPLATCCSSPSTSAHQTPVYVSCRIRTTSSWTARRWSGSTCIISSRTSLTFSGSKAAASQWQLESVSSCQTIDSIPGSQRHSGSMPPDRADHPRLDPQGKREQGQDAVGKLLGPLGTRRGPAESHGTIVQTSTQGRQTAIGMAAASGHGLVAIVAEPAAPFQPVRRGCPMVSGQAAQVAQHHHMRCPAPASGTRRLPGEAG